ncbi:5-carboxymethyl-2-hydroxymuconate Delta-isomerase [Tenuibacillus multivorans]|uniref:5-carboxymethyl-2-hydroxymuconate isomerase n=1 Tax=Tenuibacillus multivorans TaxID=237069 RepID=A0A1H0ES32_9BACI|nr:5-carboxymethyl-2-hydroxymuconate Delta-isomerase [Tenuibacillus multivorans]GEL76982.1 5-carboxymethyl-2-hydroxymuconate isomerase [Tenuibacillus multivorans]SDN85089.1 5-carboxymethyl-2-hydroxymuconate isomerase [Tenuibacillus multivorans]
MPHLTLEYTDNLKQDIHISDLLRNIHDTLLQHRDIIPIGGLRSRAVELTDYLVADGTQDDAFVHVTLKLGSGRTDEQKKLICDDLFETISEQFSGLFEKRYLALSLELYEFMNPTYKKNNIHERYKNE